MGWLQLGKAWQPQRDYTAEPYASSKKDSLQSLFDKVKRDCIAREQANADHVPAEYRNKYGSRIIKSMRSNV
jgi:hypothetical protein